MELTANALAVLTKRYFQRDEEGRIIEDAPEMFRRVADYVAGAEGKNAKKWAEKFHEVMTGLEFLPNSPVLRNFGANDGCGSACFVLPIEDDLNGIYETLRKAALVQKFGGGTGFSFSRLRPEGSRISKTGGVTSGPISFMQVFDFSLGDVIKQGGTRHGANMGILRVDHPDIRKFIRAKSEEGILPNFNLSVGITDEFMAAVKADASFDLKFQGTVHETLQARELFDLISQCAYKTGEPGMVFLDTINRHNPLDGIHPIEATNPCGEQPLLPYGSCTLGSINLSRMAIGDWTKAPAKLDEKRLGAVAQIATRFLDNVITKNHYPIPELSEMAAKTRQIGLGVMGFGDLCIKMHIRYGSPESVVLAEKVMGLIYGTARKTSEALGKEKGVFPGISETAWKDAPRRNALLTSCAPTGTLSLIANCSGGIEPHFAFNFTKNCMEGAALQVLPEVIREWVAAHGAGSPLPAFFVEAGDVLPAEHLAIQAAFQRSGVDSGVSKTINMPHEATAADIEQAFLMAWELGTKGVTVYRDGCRKEQALVKDAGPVQKAEESDPGETLPRGALKPRPRATSGPTLKMTTACGKLYVSPTFDAQGLQEVFIRTEQGGCEANTKAMGVLLSYFLRSGGSPEKLIATLQSIKCPACIRAKEKGKDIEVQSCPSGVGTSLKLALENAGPLIAISKAMGDADRFFLGNGASRKGAGTPELAVCPDCRQASLRPDSGCVICQTPGCGYSKC